MKKMDAPRKVSAEKVERLKEATQQKIQSFKEQQQLRLDRQKNKLKEEKDKLAIAKAKNREDQQEIKANRQFQLRIKKEKDAAAIVRKAKKVRPRPALSAYLLYVKNEFNSTSLNMPNLPVSEVISQIGAKWKLLSPEQRKPWETLHSAEVKRFKEEMAKYQENDPPRRPISSFMRFAGLQLKGKVGNITELSRELGTKWKVMSQEQKDEFAPNYKQELEEYNNAYAKWAKNYPERHAYINAKKILKKSVKKSAVVEQRGVNKLYNQVHPEYPNP